MTGNDATLQSHPEVAGRAPVTAAPGMLPRMLERLHGHYPNAPQPRGNGREAAVLVALTEQAVPEVILTRRADHMNSHSGEVALPGGMWEPTDADLLQTALRESWEEVALPSRAVSVHAQLPYRLTRRGVGVTPFVGLVPPDQQLVANPEELDSIFRVPLTFFLQPENCGSFPLAIDGQELWFPCYDYDHYRIWGMTLNVLVDLLNIALDARISLPYPEALDELQLVDPS